MTTTTTEIELTFGLSAIVDIYPDVLMSINWHVHVGKQTYYARGKLEGKNVYMHHLVMGSPPDEYVIDHINGYGWDNRIANLRHVPRRLNDLNRHKGGNPIVRRIGGEMAFITGVKQRGMDDWSYLHPVGYWTGSYQDWMIAARRFDDVNEEHGITEQQNFPRVQAPQTRTFPTL